MARRDADLDQKPVRRARKVVVGASRHRDDCAVESTGAQLRQGLMGIVERKAGDIAVQGGVLLLCEERGTVASSEVGHRTNAALAHSSR